MFELFYNFHGLNQEIFVFINRISNYTILPYILQIISWCFDSTNFMIVYIIYCIYFYMQFKKIDDLNQRQVRFCSIYNRLVSIGIIYTIFGFTYTILKCSVNLPRPFCSLQAETFVTIANINLTTCLSSFPSSHTGLALLVSYFIWSYINLSQKIITLLFVILVAISRITLAMHYPADIIYSLPIIIIVIIIGKRIFKIFANNIIKLIGNIIYKFIIK